MRPSSDRENLWERRVQTEPDVNGDSLTDKERRLVELLATGTMRKVDAAVAAGYQEGSGAKRAVSRVLLKAAARRLLADIRDRGMEMSAYTLAVAMKESLE